MRPTLKQCSMFVLAALAGLSAAQADTVIDNANGYTLNSKGELMQFTALAFDDKGRIIAVGSAAEVNARAPGARRVDLQGRTVLPGLIDAHGHVFGLGQMLTQLDLSQATSLEGALKAIGDYARANPGQGWLRGRGWNQEIWKLGVKDVPRRIRVRLERKRNDDEDAKEKLYTYATPVLGITNFHGLQTTVIEQDE